MIDTDLLFILFIPWLLYRIIVWIIKKQISIKTEVIKALFYFSITFIYCLTLFPFPFYVYPHLETNGFLGINLIPFKSIYGSLTHFYYMVPLRNIAGNILLFMPLGFSIPFRFQVKNVWKVILIGFSASLLVEITQLFLGTRSFDVDDLILNTLGTALGFFSYRLVVRLTNILSHKNNKQST